MILVPGSCCTSLDPPFEDAYRPAAAFVLTLHVQTQGRGLDRFESHNVEVVAFDTVTEASIAAIGRLFRGHRRRYHLLVHQPLPLPLATPLPGFGAVGIPRHLDVGLHSVRRAQPVAAELNDEEAVLRLTVVDAGPGLLFACGGPVAHARAAVAVEVQHDVVVLHGVVQVLPIGRRPPVGIEAAVAHQDDGAATGGDVLGQIGLQEGQRPWGSCQTGE